MLNPFRKHIIHTKPCNVCNKQRHEFYDIPIYQALLHNCLTSVVSRGLVHRMASSM
jgi:disulfide bond formation protein DsbB